jgi:hypothetical protein
LYIENGHAYIADSDSGLCIVDISSPESPSYVGSYSTSSSVRDVHVEGGYAYLAANEAGLLILDIDEPSAPSLVGSYDTPHLAGDVALSGTYAYVSDTWDGVGVAFHVIDVYDKSVPSLVMSTTTLGANPCGIAVREGGDIACIGKGIQITDSEDELPHIDMLYQNYPNPFNPTTEIKYSISNPCHVELVIYNVAGQRLKTLVDSYQRPGLKSVAWDGKNSRGNMLASGIYFYRLSAGDFVHTRKMVLLR